MRDALPGQATNAPLRKDSENLGRLQHWLQSADAKDSAVQEAAMPIDCTTCAVGKA